jgi:hypothetical protein
MLSIYSNTFLMYLFKGFKELLIYLNVINWSQEDLNIR